MRRVACAGLMLAVVLATGLGGHEAGRRGFGWSDLDRWLELLPLATRTKAAAGGAVLYYQDPDGQPVYSAVSRQTPDGRAFRPVHAGEDVGFSEPQPASAAAPAPPGDSQILYYRNPMGLPDTSPVPKKDNMGMDYIPVFAGEEDDGATVKVASGKLQRTGVRTASVERRPNRQVIRAPGTIRLDERRVSVVAMRSAAFVEEVADVTTGDRVARGDPLVTVYAPEIATAGAQFLTDLGSGATARVAGGARQRLENLGVPDDMIDEIARTRKPPLSMTWRAPRDGVVLERMAVEGMKSEVGEVLFRLADTSTLWVLADVPELELGAVSPGVPATIRIRGLPGRTFTGTVDLLYPQVDEMTRTTRVRIEIANPDGVLLPGMYAEVAFAAGGGKTVIAVPDSAVIDTGTRQVVFIDRGDGRFEPREVTIGTRGDGFTEVRQGLEVGDRVVVAANFLIDAESNLKAALQGLAATDARP